MLQGSFKVLYSSEMPNEFPRLDTVIQTRGVLRDLRKT